MNRLEPIFEKLDRAQHSLRLAAEAIPANLWNTSPRSGAWSAAEVIAHIMTIERGVVGAAERIFQKQPKHFPLMKRFRLPFVVAEIRLVRMKTPIPVDPQLLREKETMLVELREVRGRTLALMEKTRDRDLSAYRWRHPYLGLFKRIRMVFVFGVASDPARKADARNCGEPTENYSEFGKTSLKFLLELWYARESGIWDCGEDLRKVDKFYNNVNFVRSCTKCPLM
jgi:hypothetical protein